MEVKWNYVKTGTLFVIGFILGVAFFNALYNAPTICLKNLPGRYYTQDDKIARSGIFLVVHGEHSHQHILESAFLTWLKNLDWKVIIFANTEQNIPTQYGDDIHIWRIPQSKQWTPNKMFLFLHYAYNLCFGKYYWFIHVKNDVYIDTAKLEKLLHSINSSKPLLIGSPDFKHVTSLKDKSESKYMIDESVMIFSKELVVKLQPHLQKCVKTMHTDNEITEINRCIWENTDTVISNSEESTELFYQPFNKKSDVLTQLDVESFYPKKAIIDKAVTLHPINKSVKVYKLHRNILLNKLDDVAKKSVRLQHEITNCLLQQLILNNESSKFLYGLTGDVVLKSKMDRVASITTDITNRASPWIHFSHLRRYLCHGNSIHYAHSIVEQKFVSDLIKSMDSLVQVTCPNKKIKSFKYGYMHLCPLNGMQFVTVYQTADMKHCTAMGQMSFSVIQFQEDQKNLLNQNIMQLKEIKSNAVTDSQQENISPKTFIQKRKDTVVYLIIPLQGRFKQLDNFMKNYANHFLKKPQQLRNYNIEIRLVIIFLEGKTSVNEIGMNRAGMSLLDEYRNEYKTNNILYHNPSTEGKDFSRGAGLQLGSLEAGPNDILFFMDVDMTVTWQLVVDAYWNTKQGKFVWFPIPYSQYDPIYKCKETEVKNSKYEGDIFESNHQDHNTNAQTNLCENNGFWRDFGYGLVSMYKSDFLNAGGFDLSIEGWGEEDIKLYLSLLKAGLNVFRSRHKDLVHTFHLKSCSQILDQVQYQSCRKTKASHFASQKCLSKKWREKS